MDTVMMNKESKDEVEKERLWVKMILSSVRLTALQAFAFHGQDCYRDQDNRGNLVKLVMLCATISEKLDRCFLKKALQENKYTTKEMQKKILRMLLNKVRNKISEEVGNSKFSILVDEAQNEFFRTRTGFILRFVDDEGFVQERLFSAMDGEDATPSKLKEDISDVLARHNLHIDNMRGHGYDGASNMQYYWSELNNSLLKDCPFAYYVHWFAHPLQHALVEASKEVYEVYVFFKSLSSIMDLVGPCSKDHSLLQSAQADEIARRLAIDGPETGDGANYIGSHCCSQFRSVTSLIDTFGAYYKVLESLVVNGSNGQIRGEADAECDAIMSFQFVFLLHLFHRVMGVTEILCQALQQKPLDNLHIKNLVSTTKAFLQELKQDGWDTLLESVNRFCKEHDIELPDMNARHNVCIRRSSPQEDITVGHYYRINIFNAAIDLQLLELNNRFSERAMELLILSSALGPRNAYKSFNIDDICSLAENFYPQDFAENELQILRSQLQQYKLDVIHHPQFQNLSTISDLCRRLAETRKARTYSLIDRLIRLVLTLPISKATTERTGLARKYVKEALLNEVEEEFFEDCMIMYVESEHAANLDLDSMIDDVISLKEEHKAQ